MGPNTQLNKRCIAWLLGLWVLWAWHSEPWVWAGQDMTKGWESVIGTTREGCLAALHRVPELSKHINITCIPAGVLLRPLSVRDGEDQPATIQPYAEWDVAPEFQ